MACRRWDHHEWHRRGGDQRARHRTEQHDAERSAPARANDNQLGCLVRGPPAELVRRIPNFDIERVGSSSGASERWCDGGDRRPASDTNSEPSGAEPEHRGDQEPLRDPFRSSRGLLPGQRVAGGRVPEDCEQRDSARELDDLACAPEAYGRGRSGAQFRLRRSPIPLSIRPPETLTLGSRRLRR